MLVRPLISDMMTVVHSLDWGPGTHRPGPRFFVTNRVSIGLKSSS
jgi:hypothetical protein